MAADKRELILEAAIRLFAEKGFHSTSIQEIADAAGVAKGSTYLYFKSKDDIMLSIFNEYYVKMFEDLLTAPSDPGLTSRERLRRALKAQMEKFTEFRDFLKMQQREQFIHQNEEVKAAAKELRLRGMVWLHDRILEVYGEAIRPYALDCTTMFHAMMGSYMHMMVLNGMTIELDRLTEFLVRRLDSLAEGLMDGGEAPILDAALWEDYLHKHQAACSGPKERVQVLLRQLRELVQGESGDDGGAGSGVGGAGVGVGGSASVEESEDLLSSLQVLEEELAKPSPKRVIVQGMLRILGGSPMPGMKKLVRQLQTETAALLERVKG